MYARLSQASGGIDEYVGRVEYEQKINGAIAFYVGCLGDAVGPEFKPPSLGVLATFWVSSPGALYFSFVKVGRC